MRVSAGRSAISKDIDTIIQNLGGISFRGQGVLVTGGAGFLGSWLCEVLIEQGARVICLDNLSSGLKTNLSHLLPKDTFRFIEHDVAQPIHIGEKIDTVLHLASRASPFEFQRFPLEILKTNTVGTLMALELAGKHKARFLFTSSSEVYGDPSLIPTPESYRGDVNPIGPRSCYDEAKRCGEAYVVAYKREYELDAKIARIFNTYGPRIRADGIYGRVVTRFIEQALKKEPISIFGSGEQTRSFCYVTDQVEGLLRLAASLEGEVVNIGSKREVKILELAHIIKELTGSPSEIVFQPLPEDDPRRRCPDISKAVEILDWQPKVELEEGLNRTIKWLKERNLSRSAQSLPL